MGTKGGGRYSSDAGAKKARSDSESPEDPEQIPHPLWASVSPSEKVGDFYAPFQRECLVNW